jgi:glycogen synthase
MRILHIFDHSLPLHSGYTFRSRAILMEQHRRGWETVQLTTPRHVRPGPDPEEADGLRFYRTPAPQALAIPVLRELAEVAATTARLKSLIAQTKPDILHAHSPVLNAMAALRAGRALGLPVVYEVRATWEDAAVANGATTEGSLRYRVSRWLETRAVRQADAVGCICEGLRGELASRGVAADRLFVVPNAVDVERFAFCLPRDERLAAELGLQDAEVLGFLGSFYEYEGLPLTVEALGLLRDQRPNLRLLLVGGGPEEARLKAQVAAAGLSDRVLMIGRVPHAEVDRYYSLVDVLAYPRRRTRVTELVTPLKPLEAMAQGKLVVASDVGGHREMVEDGVTGRLFTADDPAALAAAVNAMFNERDRWDAYRQAGLAYVTAERTWTRSVGFYEPVYQWLQHRG